MPKTKIERKEILRICWEIFHREGYNSTSLQTVADAVGLGKAGLLHHFGSKEGLMRAVLGFAREGFHDYVLKVATTDAPLEDRLLKMVRRQTRLSMLEQRGCFFANTILETSQSGAFKPELKHFYLDWIEAMTTLLSERFPPAEAKERAYRYFIEYEGSILLYQLDGDKGHLEKLAQRCLEMLEQTIKMPDQS